MSMSEGKRGKIGAAQTASMAAESKDVVVPARRELARGG